MKQGPIIAGARNRDRTELNLPSKASDDALTVNCLVRDISVDGALILFNSEERPFEEGAVIQLKLPGFGPCYGAIRWIGARKAGLKFKISLDEKAILHKLFVAKS